MAKGNLFQGMARGKVGDVVFYRMNGIQMSRVRNRAPKNPRSNEQLYQRAVIATIMKAYSAGKEIFDHSFQGYTIGEGNMRRFNSVNSRILREQLIYDVNEGLTNEQSTARFVAPKSLSCTPVIGLQVSEGTLKQNLFTTLSYQQTRAVNFYINAPAELALTTVGAYLNYMGIVAGDIFTFVFLLGTDGEYVFKPTWTNDNYAAQLDTNFYYIRLIVKSNINADTQLAEATFGDIFEIETNSDQYIIAATSKFEPGKEVPFTSSIKDMSGVGACIRSRLDQDLRSTEYMQLLDLNKWGITSGYVLTIWKEEVTKVGESELVLEGGDGPALQPMNLSGEMEVKPVGMSYMPGEPSDIIPAPVDESPVPTSTRHRGTSNNKR